MFARRQILRQTTAVAALLSMGSLARAVALRPSIDEDAPSLRAIARKSGILFGCATNTFELRDPAFVPVVTRDCAILAPEYEMKRGVTEPARGHYDFSGADALVSFAATHGMEFRGHPLVWHKRNPPWLEDAVRAAPDDSLLTGYIREAMARYRGRIRSWDVVNEAIAPQDGRADNLRNTIWLARFGPSYIDIAYRAARAVDPNAMLVYNDWGCEAGAPDNDRFRAATLRFLEAALKRGVPIDALGLQGHLGLSAPQVDQKKLRDFLAEVQGMGLHILVTEHDVDDSGGPSDIAARDRLVADASRRFLDVMLDNPATVSVLTWGLSDRYLDPPGWRERLLGYTPRMLPRDAEMRRKPMWSAIAAALGARSLSKA
ncbi:MAG: endo-1,4-beta-xylanase [Rhizomicrobium sp.]